MNRTKENERLNLYFKNNPNNKKASQRKYYLANKEKINIKTNLYRKNNTDKVRTKENETTKKRKLINPVFKLKCGLRRNISMMIKRGGYTKQSKTIDILGCSFEEFKIYIETKFLPWMNWNNHGKYNGELDYGWDIDHIIPMANAKSIEDVIRLNHYSNLQPICSKINRDIKKNK